MKLTEQEISEINETIAEFDQKHSIGFGLYDFNGCHYKLDELEFHASWDWLMPVVQKCYKIDHEEGFDNLVDAVSTLNLDAIYQAVVEFIKEYNKQN